MKRNEIANNLKWDLKAMFKDEQAIKESFHKADAALGNLEKRKGHICDSKDSFKTFFDDVEAFECILDDLCTYAHMYTDVDPEDEIAQQTLAQANAFYQRSVVALNFIELEVIKQQALVKAYLKDDDCKDYRYPMDEILRRIPHQLDDEKEAMLAQFNDLMQAPEQTYESFRLTYEPVMVDGKETFLNGGNYQQFLLNPDVNVRKQAFEHYFKEYKNHQNVFMNLLTAHAKGQVLNANFRHFDSALQASLFEDGVDETLYNLVLKMGNDTYRPYVHDYFATRKKVLQLDEQHVYDIFLPLVKTVNISYDIEKSFAILKQALSPLGEDYIAMLDVAKEQRWIDYLPHEKKRSGAYSSGTYNSYPYMLMNFTNNYDSLSTFAHEFGHSMHSYYSHKNNRAMLANYRIFVAEVASTVNELLLNHYLLEHCTDKDNRAYLLNNLLNQMVGTMYRQTMYASFESELHARIERNEALSSKDICDLYEQLNKDYFGDSVIVDDLQRYGCYYIPHFYYNFYVYKYTLGMSVAISFVKKILAGDVQGYRTFLTKGGSESPIDELVHAGVDPRKQEVYDDAFGYFKEVLDEFKACMHIE